MASVALDTSLADEEALAGFVARRHELASLNSRLHPVIARAIVRMTEVSRHHRVQDLRALIENLKNYREQVVADDFNLSRYAGLVDTAGESRREVVCRHLRDRLFDFTRRNRLLYYKPTAGSLNLTVASVPLVLDVRSISPDSLLTWRDGIAQELGSLKPIPLGRYLRLEDYPYVPPALDRIRLDANRSVAELGFSQLRLVPCFLHWHNLKENQEERISSPLLLVPIELKKKKGVRDAYTIEALDSVAEVNPVLRQYLRQLYDIELPEFVDLREEGCIDALHRALVEQVQGSEPGVSIDRIERPRIDLITAQAQRRLDAYRKRVQLSGRGAKSRMGFDYSYRPGSVHPLGIQLFMKHVYPAQAPHRELHEAPQPRVFQHSASATTVEKELYQLKDGGTGGGPYEWAIDLCSVTLGNFNYRKMSLVRDYATLLAESGRPNSAFDALFSAEARALETEVKPLATAHRWTVMPADPTQELAVARARTGGSYIIQGPPGTGKSQTVANLMADYVARGDSVLFVCEKRAAIDVVFHRLRQQGLASLCCLIHDSQSDKKEFIQDLKQTYEAWLATEKSHQRSKAREAAIRGLSASLAPADQLAVAMKAAAKGADESLGSLVRRAVELEDAAPELAPAARAALPAHRELLRAQEALGELERVLTSSGAAPELARHPARLLAPGILSSEQPVDAATRAIAELRPMLEKTAGCKALVPSREQTLLQAVLERHSLALRIRLLVAEGLLDLLVRSSTLAQRFRSAEKELDARARELERASEHAKGWRSSLPADEVERALAVARRFKRSILLWLLCWLFPVWWQLRRVIRENFDFSTTMVRPSWVELLEKLQAKVQAEAALAETRAYFQSEFGTPDIEATRALFDELHQPKALTTAQEELRGELVGRSGAEIGEQLVFVATEIADLGELLQRRLVSFEGLTVDQLLRELTRLEDGLNTLPVVARPLVELAKASPKVAEFLRHNPLTLVELDAAVCAASVDATLRERSRELTLCGASLDAYEETLVSEERALRQANASAIVERVRNRFLDHVRLSAAPAGTLASDEKQLKKAYAGGRKDLEHEFGKTMRHKSIRDIVSGRSGVVARDLKPIWLMSPLSVADTLPLDAHFGVVIFDEASQIPLEDSVPAIYRAEQGIVVGDEMQLPPTTFFGSTREEGEDTVEFEEGEETVSYDLDAESLLSHATRGLPSTLLGWHYRSRDESLVTFCNRAFYDDRLLTVPAVRKLEQQPAISAAAPADGSGGAARLLERALSFHKMDGAIYEQRRNAFEAEYIAHLVRALLADGPGMSIGIVAFSEAQQGEIEDALNGLAATDPEFRARLDAELEREEDGQDVGLFVKNLENVQGDERDIIIISVCYGPDAKGRMIMNFGPINKNGGEKRLNVIFSRAKSHLALVTTIQWHQVTNEYNDGANCLRKYLRYAEAVSKGDTAEARSALLPYGQASLTGKSESESGTDAIVHAIASELRAGGYEVDTNVGASSFRVHLAVRKQGETAYRLAVLVDTEEYYASGSSDERFRLKPSVLRAFGWRVTTVLTKDWYEDSTAVMERLVRMLGIAQT